MTKKISELTAATTPLAGTELVEIVQSGVSKQVAASYLASGVGGVREFLSANRTYYVRTDGSNSNDGLANTSGGAFLTIQKAVDVIYATLDLNGYAVTIQVADGTYAGEVLFDGEFIGRGSVTINGNNSTPTNVILSTGSSASVTAKNGASVTVTNLKITNTASYGLWARLNGRIYFSGLDFGSVTSHQIGVRDFGIVEAIGNYTISGGGVTHMSAATGQIRVQSRTVTISGTPAYSSAFINASYFSACYVNGNTFSGSATGVRYSASTNSIIDTAGGGATYLPGNAAGTTANGGQYL